MKLLLLLLSSLVVALTRVADAQTSDAPAVDIEVPTLVFEIGDVSTSTASEDDELDRANIVQSAAKGVTTIQEAPSITTVVTADDLRDHQFQDILQLADTVPGWQRLGHFYSLFPTVTVRGQAQAVQFLHDGLSLFDPGVNMPSITRVQPMELIKRVEMITGPGGVLWGSNSLLGIMNVITKDADDVQGVEVGSSIGHGDGDRLMARAYVMAGDPELLGGKLKLFGHGSVESYQGAAFQMPLLLFHQPLPQPNSANTYGPLTTSDQMRSLIVNLSGKATLGKLQLRVQIPFAKTYRPLALSGNPNVTSLPEDSRCVDDGTVDPTCVDNLRTSRANAWDAFDRYVVAEYRARRTDGKAGVTLRGYGQQFVRGLNPLQVLAPSSTIQGGLTFSSQQTTYRIGSALDGDLELAKPLRVLYGAEAYREWLPLSFATFESPYDLTRLPLPCPRTYSASGNVVPVPGCELTFTYAASRSVMGAYLNPQFRPNKKLIVDAGARVQVAPEVLGTLGYDMRLTMASTLVWNFIPNWHVKLNYAQGFRPPTFNATSGNGEAVQIGGDPALEVETSDAYQAELNARIFKGERSIRELSFRLDGSYTRLQNLIQVNSGAYNNTGDRGVSSMEFLGKLHVQGGHVVELAYTWMRVATSDRGLIKSLPEHWFNFSTVFSLISKKLTATTNLKVAGAAEDPNRLVEYRGSSYADTGAIMNPVVTSPTDAVFDLLPPIADLSAGITWTPTPKFLMRATVYNALMQHAYQPDVSFDYEPHVEYLPNPYEGIRAYISAMYQY